MTSILAGSIAFVTWTVCSFFAHYFARSSLQSTHNLANQDAWFNILSVTGVQLLVGGLIFKLMTVVSTKQNWPMSKNNNNNDKKNDGDLKESDQYDTDPSLIALTMSHLVASCLTNASMLFANAGSAFTVKASEPISSAVLSSMLTGQKLDTSCIISLPMVVAGAVGFVWGPYLTFTSMTGLGFAFVSNILFGVRNINIKQYLNACQMMAQQFHVISTMSLVAGAMLCTIAAVKLVVNPSLMSSLTVFIGSALISSLFHSTYTVISTCIILKYTSVIGHATMNLMKRILVAIGFFLLGQRLLTATNIVFAVVMVTGLLIYAFPSCIRVLGSRFRNPSLCLTFVTAFMIVLVASMSSGVIPGNAVQSMQTQSASSYPYKDLKPDEKNFLNINLYNHRNVSDYLSQRLTTTTDVITEAGRIHDQMFSSIIDRKKYKKAVLVNVFTWANKGDQLIMIGQRLLLKKLGLDLVYYCYYPGYECDFSKIARTDDLVVFIQGAGYIGHPAHLYVVNKTVRAFPKNRVVIFPISSCHPTPPCVKIAKFSSVFAFHLDLHILLRDRYSYALAVNFFAKNQNYLVPDSAFAMGPIRLNILPVYDIIWLKRNDWETTGKKMPVMPKDVTHTITDWQDDWMKQDTDTFFEAHQLRAMSGMLFLSRARVVITDRLHAHIMCVLLDKPHVIVNSRTRKQDHYFSTWEKKLNNVFIVDDYFEALEKALILLNREEKH